MNLFGNVFCCFCSRYSFTHAFSISHIYIYMLGIDVILHPTPSFLPWLTTTALDKQLAIIWLLSFSYEIPCILYHSCFQLTASLNSLFFPLTPIQLILINFNASSSNSAFQQSVLWIVVWSFLKLFPTRNLGQLDCANVHRRKGCTGSN